MGTTVYCIITFLVAFLSILIGLFVITNNYRRAQNIVWLFLCLAIAGWNLGYAMTMIPSIPYDIALLSSRLSHASGIIIAPLFLTFTLIFLQLINEKKLMLVVSYVTSLTIAVLCLSDFVVPTLAPKMFMQWYPVGGLGYVIYIANFLFWVLYSHYLYLSRFKRLTAFEREQVRFFLLGAVLGFFGGSNCFPLIFGIQVLPILSVLIIVFPFSTTYAITRYRLMDIDVIVRKGLIYSILSIILTAVYFSVVYVSKVVFYKLTGANTLWFIVPAVFVLSLFIHPLFAYIQDFVDKRFFKTKYEADKIAKKFSEGIKKLMKAQDLAEYINRVAFRTFKLKGSAVYIFEEDEAVYKCYDSRGTLSGVCSKNIALDDPIVRRMASAKGIVQDAKDPHIKIAVPAISRKKDYLISGFLVADEKKSEDAFSQQDKMLLETIANQAVMSIDNAVLYMARIDARKKALLVERLNELGSSAAAVAHQTRVAMSPVIDFASQFQEKWGDRAFVEGALSKFPFDVERLRLILTGILEYSRELRLGSVEELDLKELVKGIAGLISGRAKEKNISIEVDIADGLKVRAERGRLRDVLIYLAINSLEAMPFGGRIKISASADKEKTVIKFSDNGSGIAPDVLPKVFTAFYSEKKGSIGLGLSIVKKIIEGHGGSVSIESQLGKGTTVSLVLPV